MPISKLTEEVCGDVINPCKRIRVGSNCQSVFQADTAEGKHLRKMLDKVDDMRRQRCQFLDALKEDLERDDITSKALAEKEFDCEVKQLAHPNC